MRLRNGEHGYGLVTKTLHWVTVALLVLQVGVGYAMDVDGSGRGRGRGRGGDDEGRGRGRGRGGDEPDWQPFDGDLGLADLHVAVGLSLVAVALLRLWWRRAGGLPPWDPRLGPVARRWLPRVERALLAMLVLAPATGVLLLRGDDDLLPWHVAAHVVLYGLVAAHVAIVLGRGLLPRMLPRLLARRLARMRPGVGTRR